MEWTALADGLEPRDSQLLNQSNDPRIGSGRNNSTTGTISAVTSAGTTSSSAAALGSTFVPVLIYSGICLSIFFVFRRKCRRVYAPRTLPGIRRPPLTPIPPLPDTWVSWIKDFYRIDEQFILNNTSLDGFFFLRYVRILATISFAGCVISWPVLFSVNATGGNRLAQLDLLTIGDVANPTRFYAHVLISWVFFGFILFMICRECVYYINLRQAYLMTPQQASKLSSRTVLFTCVPKRFLDEHRVRKLFGDSVKNVWIPRNTRALLRLVDERESAAVRLEKAEIELIKKANRARQKKHGTTAHALPLPVSSPRDGRARAETSLSIVSSASSKASTQSHPSPPSTRSSHSSHASSPSSSPRSSTSMPTPARSPIARQTSPVSATATTPAAVPVLRLSSATTPLGRPSAALLRLSSSSSSNVLQGALSPAIIDEIREINQVRSPPLTAVPAEDQGPLDCHHESFSDTGSGPFSSTTAAGSSNPMSDTTEICHSSAVDQLDDDDDDKERALAAAAAAAAMARKPNATGVTADAAAAAHVKHGKNNGGDDDDDDSEYAHPYGYADTLPDVRGSVAAQWLSVTDRPYHRPLANFGRRVDTIRWTRMRIKSLNVSIAKLRRRFRAGDGAPLSSMFVEFDTQAAAQMAYQVLSHHQPLHMSPRYIGIRPDEIIWSSLRMRWWERIFRRFFVMSGIAAGVVFWSIPAAFVGVVSNISFLSSKVFFLHWIKDLPASITGVIEGLLPAVALSLLMAAVPAMLRACARAAGVPSTPMVELFTQNAYFCFQVVQVFLVTTLTSAASAAFSQILADPLSAKDLLSQNLPKASNFYLSYITVQCLAGGSIGLVHFIDLFRHTLLAKTIEHPRRAVRNFQRLKQPHWGGVFPVFTNLGVIAISYTCIAPLILIFSGIGMLITYQVYKYNLLYTFDGDRDSKGLHYPRGLMHLMIGLYLAEICMIGLFSIQSAIGPVIMMVIFLIFTLIVHISLNDALTPLLYNLPRTLALEDKDLAAGHQDMLAAEQEAAEAALLSNSTGGNGGGGLNANYYDMEEGFGDEHDSDDDLHQGPTTTRGIDGAGDLVGMIKDWGRDRVKEKIKSDVKEMKNGVKSFSVSSYIPWMKTAAPNDGTTGPVILGADGQPVPVRKKANFFIRWLHPELYEDYTFLRTLLPTEVPPIEYPPDYAYRVYLPPEMCKPMPRLWIPRDEARVSRQEVAHTRKMVPITDKGVWLTPKGDVVANLDQAPFLEPIYLY